MHSGMKLKGNIEKNIEIRLFEAIKGEHIPY
jgi:hypothetical protein